MKQEAFLSEQTSYDVCQRFWIPVLWFWLGQCQSHLDVWWWLSNGCARGQGESHHCDGAGQEEATGCAERSQAIHSPQATAWTYLISCPLDYEKSE